MSEEIKFDLDGDIIMQIEMDSYMKYNDTIASMNDHLGEIYGYSDVRDTEEAQLKYEKELAYKAIKDLQQKVKQLEKENEYLKMSNPEQNMEHFRIVNENKRKIDMLRKENHQLENIRKEAIKFINEWLFEAGGNGADMDYDTIVDLLNILNKGSEE